MKVYWTLFKSVSCEEKGSALVELALIIPMLLIMIVGALDYGSAMLRKMEIANAAKAGVQYAMVRKPQGGIVSDIENAVNTSLGESVNETTAIEVTFLENCFGVLRNYSTTCTDEDMTTFIDIAVSETFTAPYLSYEWITGDFVISETSRIQLN